MNYRATAVFCFVLGCLSLSAGTLACLSTKTQTAPQQMDQKALDDQVEKDKADPTTPPEKIKADMKAADDFQRQTMETNYGGVFDMIASFIPLPVSAPIKQTLLALTPLLFPRPRKAIVQAVTDAGTHVGNAITSGTSGDAHATLASVGKAVMSPISGVAKAIGLLHTTPPVATKSA